MLQQHLLILIVAMSETPSFFWHTREVFPVSSFKTLCLSCEEIFRMASALFLFFVWSATDSWSWIGALSLIGRRLTCLLEKNPKLLSIALFIEKERMTLSSPVASEEKEKNDKHLLLLLFVSVVRLKIWTYFRREKSQLQWLHGTVLSSM